MKFQLIGTSVSVCQPQKGLRYVIGDAPYHPSLHGAGQFTQRLNKVLMPLVRSNTAKIRDGRRLWNWTRHVPRFQVTKVGES
jgi:hypothetical protein